MISKFGDKGSEITSLQKALIQKGYAVIETGVFEKETEEAVKKLQTASGLVVDGIVGPKTRIALLAGVAATRHLTESTLVAAAKNLDVPVECVRAVNEVESLGEGMLPDGRPKILFERHVFWKRLQVHGIDPAKVAAPSSILSQTTGGYQGGAAEYTRLASAKLIHVEAALESASWGAFQIMGYHWKDLGYISIDDFVTHMQMSEDDQLAAFVQFIKNDSALLAALKARKWKQFAQLFNGPDYARNLYDAKLAQAYSKYAGQTKDTVQPQEEMA